MPERKIGLLGKINIIGHLSPELAGEIGQATGEWLLKDERPFRKKLQYLFHITYLSRVAAEQYVPEKVGLRQRTVNAVISRLPGRFLLWNTEDMVVFLEGLDGKEQSGKKLDWIDRGVSWAAALYPFARARKLRDIARAYRRSVEDTVEASLNPKAC